MSAIDWARVDEGSHLKTEQLMELVVHPTNMGRAYRQVVGNKGSAGVDGMTVNELLDHLRKHGEQIKSALLSDAYFPQAVRSVEIPKPQGGKRKLGIPTVTDRLIQQALYQLLNPLYDPTFTDNSYGFRPGHNAQQAVQQSRDYIRQGKRWVVDVDLSKFFDEVHHDRLLAKLRQWKRPWTRMQELIRLGVSERKAARGAFNQRGPWWNAGASHMHLSLPGMYFAKLGLVNLTHVLARSSR